MMTLPILYSFRRCPYAIRARLALMHCGAVCELREVVLKDKPLPMLQASRKGTVPVLMVPTKSKNQLSSSDNNPTISYRTIDESIEIMHWAMNENPARNSTNSNEWKICDTLSRNEINTLIEYNDYTFKNQLDKYKYSDRHPENSKTYYLEQAMPFLERLDGLLAASQFLSGSQFRLVDAAILPFIRQFSMVEPEVFDVLPLHHLQRWLAVGLTSELMLNVMHKFPQWIENSEEDCVLLEHK